MNTVRHRYSAEIQRTKGLLELAAALYDTSLSFKTERAAEQAIQTESRVGYSLTLALTATREKGVSFSFAADGFRELQAVGQGKLTVAWINPSVAATMAFRGKGLFSKRQPIRTIAVFPSYDVMAFAVHDSTGITSLAQIAKERIPLRVSTGTISKEWVKYSPTMFTVDAVMKAAGFSFADLRRWGGKIQSVPRPSHPDRREALEKGTINAVFDEGIKSWGQTAIDAGFRYLPVEGNILKKLTVIGYRASVLPKSRFPALPFDVPTVDFSGWPMVVNAAMPEDVAHALCEAIEARRALMPTDNFRPLDMAQLCANDQEAPYDVPLHPGAKRFYLEKGYLER
ncbi:MAG TPA: TAXI family TRAP transporter solute-binding subunit [Candidatus Binatia bacterium]|nr:TAXI family TRAP transporter solute-binding subunit [Candidatus Binatia bacterium]